MKTILITGAGSSLARLVAGVLAAQRGVRVVGLDRTAAAAPHAAAVAVDLHGAELVSWLREHRVTTAVHLDQPGEERPDLDRRDAPRGDIFRTIELVGACAEAGVAHVVLRSSTLVYGARADAPALLDECAPLRQNARASLLQDYVEIERLIGDFAARHPALQLSVLRCAPLVGGGLATPLTRYLRRPRPPVWLGYAPRLQVLHLDDAAIAFALAALTPHTGPLNFAADGVLHLDQAIRLAGRRPLPLLGAAFTLASSAGRDLIGELPFDPDHLRYSCVADTRRAHAELGWAPQHTAAATVRALQGEPA
jgi:UDP-glucose 4-epimerase